MLVVGKALDTQQLPRAKGVEEESLSGPFPARPHAQRLRGLAAEREGEHGAALGNVDVVAEPLVRGPFVEPLPGGGLEAFCHRGVVLEDEEE